MFARSRSNLQLVAGIFSRQPDPFREFCRSNPKLVGAILTPLGLLFLVIGLWIGKVQYTIIKTWPTVDAEVTRSQVNYVSGGSRSVRFSSSRALYQAEIEFRYTVGGRNTRGPSLLLSLTVRMPIPYLRNTSPNSPSLRAISCLACSAVLLRRISYSARRTARRSSTLRARPWRVCSQAI